VTITKQDIDRFVPELFNKLKDKYGVGIVVLIDEYDAPVAQYIGNPELAAGNSKVLHDFYTGLKNSIKDTRFAFVTGISRFAYTAMDSDPNHFYDLSFDPEYAGICGFTITELDEFFQYRMAETLKIMVDKGMMESGSQVKDLRQEILNWYDGYNWLGPERVLNPYSILYFFRQKIFEVFWPFSGQPSHLSALIKEKSYDFIQLKLDDYLSKAIRKVDLRRPGTVPILFHSGYLTIDRYWTVPETVGGKIFNAGHFSFKFPNIEVESSYNSFLFQTIFDCDMDEYSNFRQEFLEALAKNGIRKKSPYFSPIFFLESLIIIINPMSTFTMR
jgi:hypothetical protein